MAKVQFSHNHVEYILQVNTRFGFGLLNADALVNLATKPGWETSPEKSICTIDVNDTNPDALPQ